MDWEKETRENFDKIINKVPVFMRDVAKTKVSSCAERFAQNNDHSQVTEKDLVDAFFKETPFGFHGPLKTDMHEIGIDFTKYGH